MKNKIMLLPVLLVTTGIFIQCMKTSPRVENRPQEKKTDIYDLPLVNIVDIKGSGNTVIMDGTRIPLIGSLSDKGASQVKETGFCWSTKENPTIRDSSIKQKYTDIVWTCTITELKPETIYYIKAFAINDHGIGYSSETWVHSGYKYGTDHEGGYVYYNDGAGGGLVLGKENLGKVPWIEGGKTQETLNGKTKSVGGITVGRDNTAAIIAQSGHKRSAALLCEQYVYQGYSDWFLPADCDFRIIAQTLYPINAGNITGSAFWSSTEKGKYWASYMTFKNVALSGSGKEPHLQETSKYSKGLIDTRPVREFRPARMP